MGKEVNRLEFMRMSGLAAGAVLNSRLMGLYEPKAGLESFELFSQQSRRLRKMTLINFTDYSLVIDPLYLGFALKNAFFDGEYE